MKWRFQAAFAKLIRAWSVGGSPTFRHPTTHPIQRALLATSRRRSILVFRLPYLPKGSLKPFPSRSDIDARHFSSKANKDSTSRVCGFATHAVCQFPRVLRTKNVGHQCPTYCATQRQPETPIPIHTKKQPENA
ncbi:hypothetical protein [Kingella sp. (in: b-proteobacteria)]|uniref:hypothetical protein n=1 Tax=Kingella sp. (in: b-proteobacteria) TaxID=2020713 RepID=UPI0026DC8C3F|nr:hypothetical protein [Kingella sp. (in: b-proteobacteria)]MDO4658468.1 hypothetical protein [Kingella sp. (in: b-proteobacteria)]